MNFFDPTRLDLLDFRPGVRSWARPGDQLTLVVMDLDHDLADAGHEHPFEQCGLVLEGEFELTVNGTTRVLSAGQGYFIPAGVGHGWRVVRGPVRVLDISARFPPEAAG